MLPFDQTSLLNQDSIYEKIQKKNVDVMGSLQKFLNALEQANKEGQSSTYLMEDLLRLVQQTALLFSQTNITLSFTKED